MRHETAYTMLMVSLPYLGTLFEAKYSVISRLKLERRLKDLTPEHQQLLSKIVGIACWDRLDDIKADENFVTQARQVMSELDNPVLLDIVRHRVELRTLVAALRRRHMGAGAPVEGERWGIGRWMSVIARNWNEPGFGVQNAFPWVLEAQRLLEERGTIQLERLLLEEVWNELGRRAQGHYFDFEAVVIYVLRWDVMERWTHYQPPVAQKRFDALIDAAIGDRLMTWAGETSHG